MALKISTGKVPRAQKVVLYGVEGIGKTTLAAQTPDPLFIDVEDGTSHMDVKRVDKPESWLQLLDTIREVSISPGVCATLVIDTADWAEQMAIEHICKKNNQPGIESFGYGKGYTYLAEAFSQMLKCCDTVVKAGVNVVITAHAKQRKVELPDETGAFDTWGLKLSKQCAPLLKEWPDALLFLNYQTMVITGENGSKKAAGGKRMIYTTHRATFDAKNRHGLDDVLPMTYESIAPIFDGMTLKPPLERLLELMNESGISEAEIQKLVSAKGFFPSDTPISDYPTEFISGQILKYWKQMEQTILNDPDHVPF